MKKIQKIKVIRLSEKDAQMLEVVFQLAAAAAMEAADPIYMSGLVSVLRMKIFPQLKGKKK